MTAIFLKNATQVYYKCARIFIKKCNNFITTFDICQKDASVQEKLKDVLLDIYLKPLSNDLSSLFDKKSVVMVMYETSLKN